MDWITANIAIGNFVDAKNVTSSDVDAALCLKEECCVESDPRYCVMCVPLVDGPGNISSLLEEAIDFIDAIVTDGGRVLVHCHAGRSRSVCIVARYLMWKGGLTGKAALEMIESKRDIYLSPGIEELLSMRIGDQR
jgi:protein-tyrosine phosphatase